MRELQGQIAAITGISPGCQRILVGYPPECLDLSNGDTILGDLPIQSGTGIEAGPGKVLGGPRGAERTDAVRARSVGVGLGDENRRN